MIQIAFYFLSLLAVASAIMVVSSKKPVHSVLYLVICFFAISGHYVLLNAQFLAIVNIIVYTGAIMVLFLFVVMMLNLNNQNKLLKDNWVRFSAVISGGILMLVMLGSVKSANISSQMLTPFDNEGSVQAIGKELFSTYLLPFEISSILLFSAIVGAIILAKKEID